MQYPKMPDDFPTEEEMASDPTKMAKAMRIIHEDQLDRKGRPLPATLVETQRTAAAWTGFGLGLMYGAWEIAKHFFHF